MADRAANAATQPSGGLNIALWVVQLLLAAAYAYSGYSKAFLPLEELASMMSWTVNASPWMVRTIGALELSAAFALVVPAATRILPWLTPLAAAGLVALMICAAIMHLFTGEPGMTAVTLVLGALAAFVVWGRTGKARIRGR